jgi:hypothetical protein
MDDDSRVTWNTDASRMALLESLQARISYWLRVHDLAMSQGNALKAQLGWQWAMQAMEELVEVEALTESL